MAAIPGGEPTVDIDIWVVRIPGRNLEPAVRVELEKETGRRGWHLHEREATLLAIGDGRKKPILRPGDATNLYARAHVAVVGVLADEQVRVALDYSRIGTSRFARLVNGYLRYKAISERLDYGSPRSAAAFASKVDAWAAVVDCDGDRDPRILPLHVFDPVTEYVTLDEASGRREFDEQFGVPVRRDRYDRSWEPADCRQQHGASLRVFVRGVALSDGFHWDVQNNGRHPMRVATPDRVVEIDPGRHANVYPNAVLRIGRNDGRQIATASVDKASASAIRKSARSGSLRGKKRKGPARNERGRFQY